MANPSIFTSVTVLNEAVDLGFRKTERITANEESSLVETITLTTSSTTLAVGTIDNPKHFAISNLDATNNILVGFDGAAYDQEVLPGESLLVRLRSSDKFETQTITTVADVSDSLDGKYITLEGNSGTWAIWIDTDDSGTAEPAHGQTNSAEIVSIVTNDTAIAVAAAIYADLIADTAFSADFDVAYDATVDDDLVTITDKFTGTRINLGTTANTTGFTPATTQAGAAGRSVYAKAQAGEVEALVAIMPN